MCVSVKRDSESEIDLTIIRERERDIFVDDIDESVCEEWRT